MRVALIPQPQQSAGEAPTKSSESECPSAGDFFAEIDRALNEKVPEEISKEKNASGQDSETDENNELSLFLGACLFAVQPTSVESNTILDPENSGSEVNDAKKGSDVLIETADSTKSEADDSDVKSKECLFTAAVISLQPAADPLTASRQKSEEPSVARSSDQDKTKSGQPLQNSQFDAGDKLLPSDLLIKMDDTLTANLQNPEGKLQISGEEILQEAAAKNDNLSINVKKQLIQETPKGVASAVESLPVEQLADAGKAGKATSNQGLDVRSTESAWIPPVAKADNGGQGNSNTMNLRLADDVHAAARDSHSERGSENVEAMNPNAPGLDRATGRTESQVWVGMQNKLENTAGDSGKTKISTAEQLHDRAVGMSATPERSGNSNISIPTASSHPAAPSRPGELIYEIADRIQVQMRDGNNQIRIQLKPDSLGSLEIRAETTINGVVARITAESAAVKNYLENNLHLLQQNLLDQGLKVERIQIAVLETVNQQASSDQSAQFGHAASGGRQWSEGQKSGQRTGDSSLNATDDIAVESPTSMTAFSSGRFHTIA
jgi:flagellar hook-length control protein FliK